MIHPSAAVENFSAPLHRSFLTSCFLSGSAALFILPLHLALAGAPHVATILVLAWMLSQWPIAHYLSRSGDLDKAIAASSGLFAFFVATICMMTGGDSSFALLWLLVPPIEAAFASSRRVTIGIAALCCGLFGIVSIFTSHVPQLMVLSPETRLIATAAALVYTGMLAVRISLDRKRARAAVAASETLRRRVCDNISEIFCEIAQDGRVSVIGGPVRKVLGFVPSKTEADWLFHRLHVADRPSFLSRLADAKEGHEASQFQVRFRIGDNRPGDNGQAVYRGFELMMKPAGEQDSCDGSETVVLTLRDVEGDNRLPADPEIGTEKGRRGNIRWNIIEEAGASVQAQMSEIVDLATMVETRGKSLSEGSLHQTAQRIRSAGNRSSESLSAILDLVPGETARAATDLCNVDVADCLRHSSHLIYPIAERLRVGIEINADPDLPNALVDRKRFRQALHLILSEMVETTGAGGSVKVSVNPVESGLELILTAVNRQSSTNWSSEGSQGVLEQASDLLAQSGSVLDFRSALGQGESVVVAIPVRFERNVRATTVGATATARQLARTA